MGVGRKGQAVKLGAEQGVLTEEQPQVKRVVVWTVEEMEAVIKEHGHLITVSLAAQLSDVSRCRIYHLMESGRFTRFVVFGHVNVALREVQLYIRERSERQKK